MKGHTGVRTGDGDTEDPEPLGTFPFVDEGRLVVIGLGEVMLEIKATVTLAGVGTVILFCSLVHISQSEVTYLTQD